MGTYDGEFKKRGIEEVKLHIKHDKFPPEKGAAARKWVAVQERKWLWRWLFPGIALAIIVAAGLHLKGWMI